MSKATPFAFETDDEPRRPSRKAAKPLELDGDESTGKEIGKLAVALTLMLASVAMWCILESFTARVATQAMHWMGAACFCAILARIAQAEYHNSI